MELGAEIQRVDSREALARFVMRLAEEARRPDSDFENRDLSAFLDGLAGWLGDFDRWQRERARPDPAPLEWRNVAEMLWAATMYE